MSPLDLRFEGDVLVNAGELYVCHPRMGGRPNYARVYQVHRPVGEPPYALLYEVHPGTKERWEGKRGEHFTSTLTWMGRAWVLTSGYSKETAP